MKFISSVLFLLVFQTLAFSQASPVLKHQRLDFQDFQDAFYKIEAKPTLHISEDSLKANFVKLRNDLRRPLSPLEQFKVYSEFIAKIQCGHTSVIPSSKVLREWGIAKQCLPFDVIMVNKKLFIAPIHPGDVPKPAKGEPVTKTKAKKAKFLLEPGTEIYAIDQKSIAEWMKLINPYVSSDENGIDFKYYVAGQLFDFYRYVALPENKDSVRIDYIYRKDTLSQYVHLGFPLSHTLNDRLNVKETKKEREKNFGTFSIEKNKYGYFRFESFKNSKGPKYDEFLKTSFEAMRKKKIDKLVIDLRGNTGGIIQVDLLKYLLPSETDLGQYIFEKKLTRKELRKLGVRMSQEATRTYLKNMKSSRKIAKKAPAYYGELIVPSKSPGVFKGEIVVITDEGTFSAGAALASHLKTLCGAKIVGETAGGSFYAGNAGTLPLKLRKSGLVIQLNPNFFATQLYTETEYDPTIKTPDAAAFSETLIPEAKFVTLKQKKKAEPSKDPVLKVAEKQLK